MQDSDGVTTLLYCETGTQSLENIILSRESQSRLTI